MHDVIRLELEKWGLPSAESQAYLALVRNGALGASAIASAIGIARTSVYPILESLLQKGLVETGAGLGSRYTAIPPKEALPTLMVREREELVQRDRLTGNLIKQLESVAQPTESVGETEVIQVLRDPRVIADRFERLQVEAQREIQGFVKLPILNNRSGNPAQKKAERHGIRIRVIYERAVVDHPEIKPYLAEWISGGEEARVYEGELPHKVQIFDREAVLLPLIMPGDQMRALFIRHQELAGGLSMLFDFLWECAEPIAPTGRRKTGRRANSVAGKPGQLVGSNSKH